LAELQDSITTEEFLLWLQAYRMEPWGEYRADLRSGSEQATNANIHSKRGGFAPSQFMPNWERQYEPQQPRTSEQLKQIAMSCNAMLGGTFSTGG